MKNSNKTMKQPALGSGQRFKSLARRLAVQGAANPAALAATIGRKKFGATKMAKLASKGRKKPAGLVRRYK